MRPAAGWGTVAELLNPVYQAQAFYGGKDGPNYPPPRGLLDIPGWQSMDPGAAAQAVEVSAYPDRYRNWQPVAEAILTALTTPAPGSNSGNGGGGQVPGTSRVVFPLPDGSYTSTDSFGWRSDPFTGEREFHSGSDLAAADGTPIFAVADDRVAVAEFSAAWGGLIVIEHTVKGARVASYYAHMWQHGIYVTAGETVTAGQHRRCRVVGSFDRPAFARRDPPRRARSAARERDRVVRPARGSAQRRHEHRGRMPCERGRSVMNVFPDFGAVGASDEFASVIGALLTIILIGAVLTLLVSAIVWAVSSSTGNPYTAQKARVGVFVALGTAALAGAGIAWTNFLLTVGDHI